MIILSIDVGIKNLAYCLIEKNKKTTILDWNIINLSNATKHTCQFCKKNANYKNKQIFSCKVHAKKHGFLKEDLTNIHTFKKQELINILNKKKYKHIEYDNKNNLLKIIKLNIFEKIKTINCNKINLIDIGKNILTQFDKLFNHINIDHVLIENQISKIANRMKCIQGMIAQYFIMKNNENIEFISSINKLKCFTNKKTNYNERKKLSIEYTKKYLVDNQSTMITHFDNHNKQDDLADCLLQGLWYLNK